MDQDNRHTDAKTGHILIEINVVKGEMEDMTLEYDNMDNDVTECKNFEHSVTVKIEPQESEIAEAGPASYECEWMNGVQDPLKCEVLFSCTVCLKEFVDEHAYNEHMITHRQGRCYRFSCLHFDFPVCRKTRGQWSD